MSRPIKKKKDIQIRLTSKDILFEDNHYIAVNKKSGWPVHQTLDPNRSNLFSSLKSFIKQRDKLEQEPYLALHHRLDVNTSGIVLFAKSKKANPILADLFKNRKAKKVYQAICLNKPKKKDGEIHHFLKKEKFKGKEKMTPVNAGGVKTITKYKLIEVKDKYSLVEFELVTGRMHQIRVQASLEGFPCLGDDLYGNEKINKNLDISGQLLHACFFRFFDPLEEKDISIQCPPSFSLDNLNGEKDRKLNKENKLYCLFNKPYNTLCQFTKQLDSESALCDFDLPADIYPAGRLDKDSEGLLLLTNDGALIDKMASPKFHKEKTYWVQVENIPTPQSLKTLSQGVTIKGGYKTRPCKVRLLGQEETKDIGERNPPIRERKNIPTCWLEIKITEGKNRQVRRMTAQINHPTLRLIRKSIGPIKLSPKLMPGQFEIISYNKLFSLNEKF